MSNLDDSDSGKKGGTKQPFKYDEGIFPDTEMQKVHSQLLREKAEPTEQMAPIPLILLFVLGALLFWGGYYLARYSGQFRGDVFNTEWKDVAVATESVAFDPISRGKKLFAKVCQQCHQVSGQGIPDVYPPLAGSPWLLNSEERPIKILLKGLSGQVNVLGKEFNGNMPLVTWNDRDVAAVLTFVRQNWSNDAGPITEEMVAKVREEIKERTKPWTGPEILKEHPL